MRHLASYFSAVLLLSIWLFFYVYPSQYEIYLVVSVPILLLFTSASLKVFDPYLYFIPCFLYVGANIYVSYALDNKGTLQYCYLLAAGLISYHWAATICDKKKYFYTMSQPFVGSAIKVFIVALVLIVLIKLILPPVSQEIAKALHLMFSPFAMAVIWGAMAVIARVRIKLALALFFSYAVLHLYCAVTSVDVSRMSFFEIAILFWLLINLSRQKSHLVKFGRVDVILGLAACVYLMLMMPPTELGGDALIVISAVETIKTIQDGSGSEPFMPIFNSFFVLFPDQFWLTDKPKLYNSSAWYLENVLKLDPSSYPYGVGLSLVGAGYLYGGVIGTIIIFSIIGLIVGRYLSYPKNAFELGFCFYFIFKLPFAVLRMDETFLLGAGVVTIGLVIVVKPVINNYLYPHSHIRANFLNKRQI